jgi:hypothetical protein
MNGPAASIEMGGTMRRAIELRSLGAYPDLVALQDFPITADWETSNEDRHPYSLLPGDLFSDDPGDPF